MSTMQSSVKGRQCWPLLAWDAPLWAMETEGLPQHLGRRFDSTVVPAKVENLLENKMSTKKSTPSKIILQNKAKEPVTWFGGHGLLLPSLTA